jgi:acyl-CoA synthetase (AMP-forming)/AMP-acid ligase II
VGDDLEARLLEHLRRELPGFMVPHRVIIQDALARNPNGKIDRKALAKVLADLFAAEAP